MLTCEAFEICFELRIFFEIRCDVDELAVDGRFFIAEPHCDSRKLPEIRAAFYDVAIVDLSMGIVASIQLVGCSIGTRNGGRKRGNGAKRAGSKTHLNELGNVVVAAEDEVDVVDFGGQSAVVGRAHVRQGNDEPTTVLFLQGACQEATAVDVVGVGDVARIDGRQRVQPLFLHETNLLGRCGANQ